MSEDLKDILTLSNYISDYNKRKKSKKDGEPKRKSEIGNREILSLTGGLFPTQPASSLDILHKNEHKDKNHKVHWVLVPMLFGDSKHHPTINHWIPQEDQDKISAYSKFNLKIELVKYTKEEYDTLLAGLDPSWTKEETDYLWDLCEKFDLRFLVIHDQYDPKYNRSVEDIKERYYSISRKILESRGESNNPLSNYTFDSNYEKLRKYQLEKFMMRPKDKNEEEKKIIEELRKLDNVIKREEKEQKNLETIMKLDMRDDITDDGDEEEEALKKISEEKKLNAAYLKKQEKIAYLRSSLMHVPLPISARMNKKMNLFLSELNIPLRPIPTSDNEKLYDALREKCLKMFSLQKHLKKKEIEKKKIEEMIQERERPPEDMQRGGVNDKRKNPYPDPSKDQPNQFSAKKLKN